MIRFAPDLRPSDDKQDDAATVTRLFFGLILVLTAFAQATLFPAVNVLGIGPNLVLVFVLVWSGMRGVAEGLLWAFPLGLLLDLLALSPLGTSSLALIPVVVIGGLARRRLFHSGVITPMLAVVAATLAYQFISVVTGALTGPHYPLALSVKLGSLMALLNMVVVPPLYLVIQFMERMGVGRATRA